MTFEKIVVSCGLGKSYYVGYEKAENRLVEQLWI